MLGIHLDEIFYDYLRTAKSIKIVDPYIRQDYQIKNLIAFLNMIAPPEGNVEIESLLLLLMMNLIKKNKSANFWSFKMIF